MSSFQIPLAFIAAYFSASFHFLDFAIAPRQHLRGARQEDGHYGKREYHDYFTAYMMSGRREAHKA